MKTLIHIISLPLLATQLTGCAAQRPVETVFDPCHRAQIRPAPVWTASAAWAPERDRVLLVGPERHSLLVYNLRGDLEREVALDPLAPFEYSTPVRLQETDDGYLIGDKTQLLWLDRSFHKRRLWKPFEHLKDAGIAAGTLSDFTVIGRTVYAFADFVWDDREAPEPRKKAAAKETAEDADPHAHQVPDTATPPAGNWFRGFAKIDLEEPDVVTLHRFDIEDRELNAYYLYDQRPYVTDLDKRAYVLRYTDPPQLFRSSRKTLEPFYSAAADFRIGSVLSWNGRLFLVGSRRIETTEDGASEVVNGPSAPVMAINRHPSRAELLEMQKARPEVTVQKLLIEIDPKSGQTLGTYRLPTTGGSMKLVPGAAYWAMIEESSAPNLHPEDKVHLTLLPSSWLDRRGPAAGSREVVLECPAG